MDKFMFLMTIGVIVGALVYNILVSSTMSDYFNYESRWRALKSSMSSISLGIIAYLVLNVIFSVFTIWNLWVLGIIAGMFIYHWFKYNITDFKFKRVGIIDDSP